MKVCPVCHASYSDTAQFCAVDGARLQTSQPEKKILSGQVLAERYSIVREIHSKGLWSVYQGRELGTEQKLTIKVMAISPDWASQNITDFLQRLQKMQRKYHPGLIGVISHGMLDSSHLYVVSEWIEGKTLQALLADLGALSIDLSLQIIEQVLGVLVFLHQHGIDLPHLHPGKVFLLGSGESQLVKIDGIGEPTMQTAAANFYIEEKNNYLAPEIFYGQQWDTRCEVYTAGVMLYEMIAGVLPYPQGLMLRRQGDNIPVAPPLRRIKPGHKVPRHCEHALQCAIAWLPTHRFADSNQFLQALQKNANNFVAYAAAIFLLIVIGVWCWQTALLPLVQYGKRMAQAAQHWWSAKEDEAATPVQPTAKKTDWGEIFRNNMEIVKARPDARGDTATMCYVPPGKMAMGDSRGELDEQPVVVIDVAAFYIDASEVSNAQYEVFVRETGLVAPSSWINKHCPANRENYPVVEVNWYDAALYAAWRGKKLPTEAEWEKAAHGDDTDGSATVGRVRKWPWGNTFASHYANVASGQCQPVGQFPDGKSPFGALDMAGNVWEWTASWYDLESKRDRVIRGGSFLSTHEQARTTYRDGFLPHASRNDIGFRCVKEAK